MSNRYRQTADLLPALGTVLRSVCDHPSNYSFGLDPRRRSPNGHPQRATPRSVSSRGTVGGDRSANKVLRPCFRAASPRKNRTVSCSSGRTELLWPLYSLLHRASAVRSYAVKWCVVKINDFLMIFGSSHGDRSAAAFRVIPSTKPKTRALCRASRCEHASNARRIALTWVRTVLAYGSWFSHVPPPAPGPIIRLTIPAHRDNLRGQDDTLRQYASFVKFTVRTYKLLYTESSGVGHDPGSLAAAQKFSW